MSNYKRNGVIIGGILVGLTSAFILYSPISYFINNFIARSSVSKDRAISQGCNQKDTTCFMQEGKIISKKLTANELQKANQQFANNKDQHIQYATNVALAINAIRKHTGVADLNLQPLKNSTPSNISYFCSTDNKCWAVDNNSHKVVSEK